MPLHLFVSNEDLLVLFVNLYVIVCIVFAFLLEPAPVVRSYQHACAETALNRRRQFEEGGIGLSYK